MPANLEPCPHHVHFNYTSIQKEIFLVYLPVALFLASLALYVKHLHKRDGEYGQPEDRVSHSNADVSTLQLPAPEATNLPASHPQTHTYILHGVESFLRS
jgi:hypothetical protein